MTPKTQLIVLDILAGLILWTFAGLRNGMAVTTAFVIVYFLVRYPLGLRDSGLVWKPTLKSFWLLLAAIPATVAVWAIGLVWGTANADQIPGLFPAHVRSYMFFAALQELLYLGCIYPRQELASPKHAVLYNALRFAAWHIPNPVLMPVTFLNGLITSAYFRKYCNVYVPMAWHAIVGCAIASYWPHWTIVVGFGFVKRYVWPVLMSWTNST